MSLMFANHYQYLYIEDIVQNQTYQQKIWYFVGSQTSEYVYVVIMMPSYWSEF